jgi:transmembrane sensor
MSEDRKTTPPQIIDEASEWFVIMREPNASAENRTAFAEWLRTSPTHIGAYLEIARLWADAAHIDGALAVDLDGDQSPNVVPLREGAVPARPKARSRLSSRRLLLAASLAIAFIASSSWLYINRASSYVTDIGEQRTITLEDGSVVKLNSRSKFTVRMSPKRRQIELVEGQALFDVAHDASRPFIVTSGNSAIRAVGTQFDVNRKQSGTIVTVIEGRVKLDSEPSILVRATAKAEPAAVFVSAGQQVHVAASGAMERTESPNAAAAISWLQQELVFEGQPLSDVLEEFNRYSRVPIVLVDPTLGDLRINAVFHTTNPDSLLRFISRHDQIQIERSEKEIRISKRQ